MKMINVELIESTLSPAYLTKLAEIGWDLQEKSYDKSISRLESLELGINRDIGNQKKIDAATKSNTIITNGKGKSGGDKNNNNQLSFQKCPLCKKTHKGKGWFGPGGEKNGNVNATNNKDNNNKNFLTSRKVKRMMQTMTAKSKEDNNINI
jgi:hypothetical protein